MVLGRAIGRDDERVEVTTLGAARLATADMATLIIIGSAETRAVARDGRAPLVYTPRACRRGERMIEPSHRILHGLDRWHHRQDRPAQHDHRDAEGACRRDLAVGRGATAVLRYDHVDTTLYEKLTFVRLRGTARAP